MNDTDVLDVLVTNPQSGQATGLDKTVRRAIKAMEESRIQYCVINAVALAARGLPRMTRDLDVAVRSDDADRAIAALRIGRFVASTPIGDLESVESMIIFVDPQTNVDVDLLLAEGDPEASAIADAPKTKLFGVNARVATLEHLLLLYLYSNQPRHLGDFAAIVQSGRADLAKAERLLFEMHPEMLSEWKQRLAAVISPPPAQ